jgi:hypothetical protein
MKACGEDYREKERFRWELLGRRALRRYVYRALDAPAHKLGPQQ